MNNKWNFFRTDARWILVLIAALFCSTWLPLLISSNKALLWRDLSIMYPIKKIWAEGVLATGFPPLWTSAILGGSPYLADCIWGSFNPLNLVFLAYKWLPFPLLFSWFLFFHHVVLGFGSFLLGLELTKEKKFGYLFAFFALTNGATWSCLYLPHMLGTLMVSPYFFLFLFRFVQQPRISNLFPLSACIGFPILFGDPQSTALYGILASLLFISNLDGGRALKSIVLLGILSFLFSAIQSLPSYHLAKQSVRLIHGLNVQEVLWWSFHPMRFIEWIWPIGPGWQERFSTGPDPGPFVLNTFYGIGPLVLLALSLSISLKKRNLHLWACSLAIVMLAIGGFWPGKFLFFAIEKFPAFAIFRYPERLLCFVLPIFLYLIFINIQEVRERFKKFFSSILVIICFLQFFQFLLLKDLVFFPQPSQEMNIAENVWSKDLFELKRRDQESWNQGAARRFHSSDQSTLEPNASGSRVNSLVTHDWMQWSQNIPAYFDFDTATGYHTLQPEWYLNFWKTFSKKQNLLFSLLGIRYFTTNTPSGKPELHENSFALPYIYFPQILIGASGVDGAALSLVDHEANIHNIGVIGENRIQDFRLPLSNDNKNRVLNLTRGFGSLSADIDVRSTKDHVFIWNEKFSEGWTAKVDGNPVLPIRANIWALGIPLPAAQKVVHVEFQYHEANLQIGIACFFAWLLMALFFRFNFSLKKIF